MVSGELPAGTILVDAQSMSGREMPSEHLAAPAAFETNDIIAMNGSADGHRGYPLDLGFGCWFSESREHLMDRRDERAELVGCDLVSPNVSCDDIASQFSVRCGPLFIGHLVVLPVQIDRIACPANRDDD
jgi:hypothetical protein